MIPAMSVPRFGRTGPAGALALLLGACAVPTLPAGFADALAEAPTGVPARIWLEGGRVVATAAPLGPGGLPAAARTAAETIAPAGDLLFAGAEEGPAGSGFRVDKRYVDGASVLHRSVLVTPAGDVLERSHSVELADVPFEVLETAMRTGRDVTRCDIVSGPHKERGWRAFVRDGGGREFVVSIALDGQRVAVRRVVSAIIYSR